MKSFFSRRRTRFIAAVTLLVWLLAAGAGMANACTVQENHARHGHLSHQEAGDHATSPAKMACQNFCAAEQTGVLIPQADDPAQPDVALAPGSMWWGLAVPADPAARMPAVADPPVTQAPVFIRFLRLTI